MICCHAKVPRRPELDTGELFHPSPMHGSHDYIVAKFVMNNEYPNELDIKINELRILIASQR